MANPNISATLAPADKTTMQTNVTANKTILDVFGVNLTPEQRHELFKTGPDSVSFVQDGLSSVTSHAEILPGDMNALEYGKDVKLFADLMDVWIQHAPYWEKLEDTIMAVGSECILQTNRIYKSAKDQAKNNNALDSIVTLLGKRYEKLKGPRKVYALQKVVLAPGASITINNVPDKSPIANDGTTTIMVCDGAQANCTNGTLIADGSRGIANKGSSTVTVTNQSTTTNASFSIKVEVV
jgi:hypothetical protein